MEKICYHCIVTGKVQGVWYRATTQKEAQKLGVKGWVRNLPDGRVETLLCGNSKEVNVLREWLLQGPEFAQVEHVDSKQVPWQDHDTFQVL